MGGIFGNRDDCEWSVGRVTSPKTHSRVPSLSRPRPPCPACAAPRVRPRAPRAPSARASAPASARAVRVFMVVVLSAGITEIYA